MSKEWFIGPHRMWYDKSNGVLYAEVNGLLTLEQYLEHLEVQKEIFKGSDVKRNSIYLINGPFKVSKETRTAIQKKIKYDTEQNDVQGVEKIAFVGVSSGLRVMLKIWLKLSNVKNGAFFKTEEEALRWFEYNETGQNN
jgi:hypothetical protein